MKKILTIVDLLILAANLHSQCTAVNQDGSVTINSLEYSDAVIERKINETFSQIGSFSNHIYTDSTANANDGQVFYRLQIDNKEFSTIYLTGETSLDNQVKLNWQTQDNYQKYKVYRRLYENDTWTLISDEIDTKNYSEPRTSVCKIEYRIEGVKDDCSSFSNILTISKTDNQEPGTPELLPIVIEYDNNNEKLQVEWMPADTEDIWGYVICRQDENDTRIPLDTLYGADNKKYYCDVCSVTDTNYITIFSFDSCMNTSPLSNTLNNIVLKAHRDNCSEPVHLSWNSSDLKGGAYQYVHTYNVYMIENGIYTRVKQDISETQCDIDIPITDNDIYLYVSEDENVDHFGSAISNRVKITTGNTDTLDYIKITNISISEDNLHAQIHIVLDSAKQVKAYELYRQTDDGDFQKVMDIDYTGSGLYVVQDELDLSASDHIYTYYAAAQSICGGQKTYSNRMSSVRLKVDASNNEKIKLTWNAYDNGFANIKYNVYTFNEGDCQNKQLLNTTPSLSYVDNTAENVTATDKRYYIVQAVASEIFPSDNTNLAYSSNTYAKFETIFFCPNAFAPKDGVNTKLQYFKPECHFVRSGTYKMQIFNRLGTLLFETNDPETGWDGTYKNEYCPVGVYVYKISFTDSEGMQQNKKGEFMLFD